MNPTTPASSAGYQRYTTFLAVLNVCLAIAAVLLFVGGIIFFCASYLFNDSGSVPQVAAPTVHALFLDSFIAAFLFVWQFRTRKHLFAMLPGARKSMVSLGVAYLVVAVINLFQLPLLAVVPAAIGIWWIVVFSSSTARAAFENPAPVEAALPVDPPPPVA